MTDDIERIRERRKRELVESHSPDESVESRPSNEPVESRPPDESVEIEDADQLAVLFDRHDTVLVDFHATWCGPCRMMEPAVERVAGETDAVVAKVDVDAREDIARSWGVRSMPTLVVVEDGEQRERVVGAQSYDALRDLVA